MQMRNGWVARTLRWLCTMGAGAVLCVPLALPAAGLPDQPLPFPVTHLVDGGTLPAAQLKGKVVLVNFWATWCGYCRDEIPELVEFYRQHRDQGFEVVALSIEDDEKKVADFARRRAMPFPVGLHRGGWDGLFGRVRATPTAVLIDRSGRVREVMVGGKTRGDFDKILKLIEQDGAAPSTLAEAAPR